MIALDNGPADGDYVRYIDGLIAATRTTATAVAANPAMSSPAFVPVPTRTQAATPVPSPRMTPTAANAVAAAMLDKTVANFPNTTAIPRGLAGVLIGIVLLAFGIFSEPVRGFLVLLGIFSLGAGARTLTRAVGTRVVTT